MDGTVIDVVVMDVVVTLRVVAGLSAVGVVVSAVEDLVRRDAFDDCGILSWPVGRLGTVGLATGWLGRSLDVGFRASRFRALLILRLVSAVAVIACAAVGPVPIIPLLLVFATTLAFNVRSPYGLDGAHQLTLLTFAALTLAAPFPDGGFVQTAALSFVVIQVMLSYFIAGVSKAVSPVWRDGSALPALLSTQIYGHAFASAFFEQRPTVSALACWSVILFECAFPLVIVLPQELGVFILTGGVLFHTVNAVLMGLNGFLIAFTATYPALWWAANSFS